jgi:hypothetical protein
MTTTLELPEDLVSAAKREASGRGESLQSFIAEAIRSRLHTGERRGAAAPSIMDFAGVFRSSRDESLRVMETVEEGCEQVRPEDWR